MEFIIYTCLYGAFAFVLWKIVSYMHLFRKLMKLPQKPSHWLFGHLQTIKNSNDYIDYGVEMMHSGAKVYCVWIGPFPVLGVTHPETFKQLINQASRKPFGCQGGYDLLQPWLGDGLLLSSGKKWERNRRLLTPAFHFGILSGYVATMNEVADTFLEKIASKSATGKSFNVFPVVCRATLDTMMRCSLSFQGDLQENEENEYVECVNRLSELGWIRATNPFLANETIYYMTSYGREERRLLKTVHQFTGNIIDSRRKEMAGNDIATNEEKRLDFLDILLTAKDEQGEGLSGQEIQDEVDTFTFEGHDTTASAISWAIYSLAIYPDIQQKVFEDVKEIMGGRQNLRVEDLSSFKYLPLFIKESLRYWSPVPLIGRGHTSTIVLDGYQIPAGHRVDISIMAMHKNPEVWKEPKVFNPDRFDSRHRDDTEVYGFIPFSAGSRNCIGQVFANNEMKIILAKMILRFEILRDPENEPEVLPDVVTRSKNGIRIILKERQ